MPNQFAPVTVIARRLAGSMPSSRSAKQMLPVSCWRTVSELAAALHCEPTTATYHLRQLAAALLITREKSGPSVRVSRTARGDELVDLLSN